MKPSEVTASPRALFLSPEAPYPTAGGGALRSASLLEWLTQRYDVDAVSFHSFDAPRANEVMVLPLPRHARHLPARAWRNLSRLVREVPPLVDRFGGFAPELNRRLAGRRYALGVIEHFWCAPYLDVLKPICGRVVLDLHNIESELHRTGARAASWPVSTMQRRFAGIYRELEQKWLPGFDAVLIASSEDAGRASALGARKCIVYPNAIPFVAPPERPEQNRIMFSGNLEYHPNQSAVRWFRESVWPQLRGAYPTLEWWLAGKNPEAVAALISGDPRIHFTGPYGDAVSVLAEAKVCVVPILEGSGTRFKILEAWAAGRAVVSTTLGAEGLGAHNGVELLIADTPLEMAAAISRLLDSEPLRRAIGDAGRAVYEKRFTWQAAWKLLDENFVSGAMEN